MILEDFPVPNPDAWRDPETLQVEFLNQHKRVDYRRIVRDNGLLLLGDSHFNGAIREHLIRYAKILTNAGIKHLGVEYPKGSPWESVLKDLQKGERDDQHWLNSIWATAGAPPEALNYDLFLEIMAYAGMEIAPIDSVDYGAESPEEREPEITKNVRDLIDGNPHSKIAVFIGASHTMHGPHPVPSLRVRLTDQGISPTVVRFVGGYEPLPERVNEAIKGTDLVNREWMLDLSPYKDTSMEFGGAEFLVHLPRREIAVPAPIFETVARRLKEWLSRELSSSFHPSR